MLFVIHGTDRANSAAIREGARDAHFAYLDRHGDKTVLAGAALAEDGTTRIGSVLIVNVPSREAAERFSANEPFRKSGLFETVTITRMRRGQWHPENAPKTPDGD